MCHEILMKIGAGIPVVLRFWHKKLEAAVLILLKRFIYEFRQLKWTQMTVLTSWVPWRRLRFLSKAITITANIRETVSLVLLIEWIYRISVWDDFMWHYIYIYIHQVTWRLEQALKGLSHKFNGCNVGIPEGKALEILSMGPALNFWHICTKFHKGWQRYSNLIKE
jgi:hypothetical protein